jgi:two-component system chemotaxis sensor kinase CheA
MQENQDIVKDFLVESAENLDLLDRDFVHLEEDPGNKEIIARIFRAVHTVKGTCGFFGFSKLESVSHIGENLLSKLREGVFSINEEMTTQLLRLVDAIREILANIEKTGAEGDGDYSDLIAALTRLQEAQGTPAALPETAAAANSAAAVTADDSPPLPLGEQLIQDGKATREAVNEALKRQQAGDPRHIGEILVEHGHVESNDVVEVLKIQNQAQSKSAPVSESSIRVDVRLLDKLMNMVGELVLARNQTIQFTAQIEDSTFQAAAQRLSLITTELQEGVMKTRMQPIGNVWSKFPRVVRDVSASLNKNVRLEMEGQDTEVDKTVLEAIKDPLTHIVRNSVDHGIESPAERKAAGKSAEGLLLLRAYHEGGQVIIEIVDDGKGINTDRVRQKAIERGLITEAQASKMSEREIVNLVFLPGFSMAEVVTNFSGRGVGMDVVKTNIEKIGGAVDIHSERGRGTTLKIKIPLTLAIVPALIVTCGRERYAVPQVNLLELVRLEEDDAARTIENIHGSPVYRLRGKLLPLVHLRELLQLGPRDAAEKGGKDDSKSVNIVVLQAERQQFGLVVESVQDTEEIVVKPLGAQLKQLNVFAGAAIMGDGRIALILDVMGIGRAAGIMSESTGRVLRGAESEAGAKAEKPQSLLLVRHGESGRLAIPLAVVARLEEFPRKEIEQVGERSVIQYRNQILPLFHLSRVVGGQNGAQITNGPEDKHAENELVRVVVYSRDGRDVGLVVEEIIDITDEAISVTGTASRPGVKSTAVVQGKVTEILDMEKIIRTVLPAGPDGGGPAVMEAAA